MSLPFHPTAGPLALAIVGGFAAALPAMGRCHPQQPAPSQVMTQRVGSNQGYQGPALVQVCVPPTAPNVLPQYTLDNVPCDVHAGERHGVRDRELRLRGARVREQHVDVVRRDVQRAAGTSLRNASNSGTDVVDRPRTGATNVKPDSCVPVADNVLPTPRGPRSGGS